MKDNPLVPFAFDPTELVREAQARFGWSETDLGNAMTALMGAATSGMKVLTGVSPMTAPAALGLPGGASNPLSMFMSSAAVADDAPYLAMVYGPKPVREAVALQIASITGLQREAIMDMMPVAATLALGQIARPYVPEDARELLDAFMRGYARGRPKPVPSPADYFQGYAQAMQSFWTGFLKPFGGTGPAAEADDALDPHVSAHQMEDDFEDDLPPDDAPEDTPEEVMPAEAPAGFEAMVSDWMSRSREMQVSQFRAFDSLFERARRDMDTVAKGK